MLWQRQLFDHALTKFRLGQEAMPILGGAGEDVGNAGLHTEGGLRLDAQVSRDGIGGDKANAINVFGKLVGVLRDYN